MEKPMKLSKSLNILLYNSLEFITILTFFYTNQHGVLIEYPNNKWYTIKNSQNHNHFIPSTTDIKDLISVVLGYGNETEVYHMLTAVRGKIQGNTVVVENEDLRPYEGTEVVITLLETPISQKAKKTIDWDSFSIPSERGKDVDRYMKEMRENDRL